METAEDALQGPATSSPSASPTTRTSASACGSWCEKGSLVSAAAAKEPEDTVYRLYYAFRSAEPGAGPPGAGHQPWRAGGRAQGERGDGPGGGPDPHPPGGAEPRRPGHGLRPRRGRGRLRPADLPSVEREMRGLLTEQADEGAIKMFGLNLKPLLMQPPVKGNVTMGLDPATAPGCKVAVVDATGKVLDTAVVYPTHGQRQKEEAIDALAKLIRRHGVAHIAIGNGTASRETEQMTVEPHQAAGRRRQLHDRQRGGGSVYSASKLAAEEFPDYDVNLRSAVSIARRLQDPLAELVKIDPKSHRRGPVPARHAPGPAGRGPLGVVEDCVNAVGVDLNTASAPCCPGGGAEQHHRQEHGELPGGERGLHHPEGC